MAQFDGSFYLQSQAPDIMGGIERGMRMGDMMKQRRKESTINQTFQESGGDPIKFGELMKQKGYGLEGQKIQGELQAQKANELKLGLQNQYNQASMIHSLLNTVKDQTTFEAAKAQAKAAGIPDVDQIGNVYDPQFIDGLKQQYGMASMTFEQQLADQRARENMREQRADRQFDRQLRIGELKDRREERQDIRDQKREEKLFSLKTPFGVANSEQDAKDLKTAFESKQSLDNKLQQMIDLRKKHEGGAVLNREDVARAKQLSQDALLEYKNLAKLGVLSTSDEEIINAIIPKDPLEFRSPIEVVSGQDAILNNLEKFKEDKQKDFETRIQTRLRSGAPASQQQNEQQAPTSKPAWAK